MNERMDLYTCDRIPTGETVIRGEAIPEGRYILVSHVLIFNTCGELLIQKRSLNKDRWPGLWDISICGGVISGETTRDAAVREAREELGIELDLGSGRPVVTTCYEKGFDDFFSVTLDLLPDKLEIARDEIDDIRYATFEEIEHMIRDGSFFPADIDLLRYLFTNR